VSILAVAQPSEAKIAYTPTHKVLHGSYPPKTLPLDLNNDGTVDFTIFDLWIVDQTLGPVGRLYPHRAQPPNGIEAHIVNFGTAIVSALPAGARVGRNAGFVSHTNPAVVMCVAVYYSSSQGNWCNQKNRYVGLRFSIKGKTHYGWARFSTTLGRRSHITATLTGYAYETIPGKAIIAGKTRGSDDRAEQTATSPATLGRLALGRK
jgi:hypothetical protein